MIAHSEQNEPLTNEKGIMRDLCTTKTKATIANMIFAPESSYITKNLISRPKRVQVDSHGAFTLSQSRGYNNLLLCLVSDPCLT